jgi:hypothetical protein
VYSKFLAGRRVFLLHIPLSVGAFSFSEVGIFSLRLSFVDIYTFTYQFLGDRRGLRNGSPLITSVPPMTLLHFNEITFFPRFLPSSMMFTLQGPGVRLAKIKL